MKAARSGATRRMPSPLTPLRPTIASSTSLAARIDEARKNTQATVAATKVRMRLSHTHFGVRPYFLATTCTDWYVPHSRPQKTNVQAAPCQRPPSRKVISRLRTVSASCRASRPAG